MKGLASSAATRADLSGSSRGSPADTLGDLRVTVWASPPGTPPRTSYSSRSEHPVRFPGDFAGPSHGTPSISFGAPSLDRMLIAASGDGFTSSEDEGAVGLPPSGVVATAALDPELTSMLARAAVSIGLEVNRPPSPEPSWLDDWFLGAGRGSQLHPAPVPFFPEVHEELTSSWMAPFTARSRSSASSVLTTLDGGVAECTCTHETPPLGGTVRFSRPRPVIWQPLSRPKLTVLQARQTVCNALPPHSRPRPILPVAKRVRFGDDIPPHAPLASPVRDPGSSVRMPQNALPSVPSTPTLFRCTTTGTLIVPLEPLAQRLEAWLTLPSLSHWLTAHNSTRLRDSVRQATSQVQRRSRDVSGSPERPCLARGDCCPPGKGCNRAGPSSRDEAGVLQPLLHRTQERWWPSANPGSVSLEPGFAQAPVQDADAQAHDQMHSAPGLVCSDRPEGRLLSRFDPSATQTVSTVCVRRSGMAVQGPPLRALPVSPCVHEGCRGRPYPFTGSGRQDPQQPRWLAYPSPIQSSWAITGTWCSGTSASWGFGSTGKRASSPLCR